MKSGLDAMSLFPLDDLLSGEFSGLEQNGKNKKKSGLKVHPEDMF